MSKAPDLKQQVKLPKEVVDAAKLGDLVIFVGAGASMLLGFPSWKGWAYAVLQELRDEGFINYSEFEQLLELDVKKQLSISKLIAKDNMYSLDLGKFFKEKKEEDKDKSKIYQYLNKIGCSFVTTNYDKLLVPKVNDTTSIKDVNRFYNTDTFLTKHLDTPATVVHLHGCICEEDSMIVTTKDYLNHYDNGDVIYFLKELFQKKTVLFIGYGLEETEILEHIFRRGGVGSGAVKKRFALQGFFKSHEPLYEKLHLYYEKSFGVHLIGFERDHEDYKQLEMIVKEWSEKIEVGKKSIQDAVDEIDGVF